MTENKKDQKIEQKFYTIPLRDIVIFPKMTATILVGREKSINTIEEAYNKKSPIFAITQTKFHFPNSLSLSPLNSRLFPPGLHLNLSK
jgi:ATP-dependent Lon protease